MTMTGDAASKDSGAWSLNDIGHTALDVFGVLPVVGEAADLSNAVWYAAENKYLDAGLSLISTIPIVGDLIGKGGKVARKLGPRAAKEVLAALKTLHIEKHLDSLRGHPQLGPYIDKIQDALKAWQTDLAVKADSTDAVRAVTKCPDRLRKTSSGLIPTKNPEKTTTILGRWEPDMKDVKSQINPPENMDFGPKVGEFNILNAPGEVYKELGPQRFFDEVNKPFLDKAIARGDDIVIASNPFDPKNIYEAGLQNGKSALTTFGKEIEHLYRNGYTYDSNLKAMVKP